MQGCAAALLLLLLSAPMFAAASPSTGCANAVKPSGNRIESITLNGTTRTFKIVIPPDADTSAPLPLVFGFHHSGGSLIDAENYGVITAPNAEPSIYVLPQGLVRQGRTGWNETCGGDDMTFVAKLISKIEAESCVDSSRRFAYGFSWGADMSNSVGCCLGKSFRAIAPESGGVIGANLKSCENSTPGFMLQSGLDDHAYGQAAFANVVKTYQKIQGCSSETEVVQDGCVSFKGCKDAVIWCSFPGLEHALEPNSGKRIWSFFSSYH